MKSFLATLLLLTVPLLATAQLISNPNPPVPAALGVAGAYTAAVTGAESPFWNPAGLAYGTGTEARFAYQQPWSIGFLSHLSASGFTVLPKNLGGLGIGVQSLGTRSDGHTMSAETEAFISHGIMLQKDIHSSLAFGYTLKLINYDLGESVADDNGMSQNLGSSMTFGLDVGATAQLWDRFKLGGSLKNVNQPQLGAGMKRDLPRIISGGLSYFPYYGVRTTFDVERVISGETQFKGGIAANVIKPLDLRFGVMTNPNSFTAGFGFHWRELVIDYAFVYHTILNPSHLIGIGFNLDQSLAQIWGSKGGQPQRSTESLSPPAPQPKVLDIAPEPPKVIAPPPPAPMSEPQSPPAVVVDTAKAASHVQPLQPGDDRAQIQTIYFDKNKIAIPRAESGKIAANAQVFNRNPNWKIVVVGHTDQRGNKRHNEALARGRASGVKKALVSAGVKASRLRAVSADGEHPADTGTGEAAWAKNRRVEFEIK